MGKFTRVDIEYELRADADGMPVFRECFDNELLLSFYDDEGARAFEDWWFLVGAESLAKYCQETEGYKHLIK